MTPDMQQIEDLVAWAEAESTKESGSAWNQEDWVTPNVPECGTAYCIAGKAVSNAGYSMLIESGPAGVNFVYDAEAPDGRGSDIGDLAQQLLGLTEEQSEVLFYAYNTIEDLKRITKELASGESLEEEADYLQQNY